MSLHIFFKRFFFLFAGTLFIIGCRQDPKSGLGDSTLYIQTIKDPERLNPIMYPLSYARMVNQNIFLPLADYDPFTLKYEAILIDKIPVREKYNAEGIKYDIRILKAAEWSDGKPITAEDYLFTIKLGLHPLTAAKSARSIFSSISKVDIDPNDAKHFTVYFEEDNALTLEMATNFDIMPAHLYDPSSVLAGVTLDQLKDTTWFNNAISTDSTLQIFADHANSQVYSRDVVSGAGPYELLEWKPEEVVVLRRKENYWAKDIDNVFFKQNPKTIIFKIIPDEVSAVAQLKSGLVDFIPELSAESYMALQADSVAESSYFFYENFQMRYFFLPLNNEHPVLKFKAARHALSYATNVDQYIKLFEKGMGQATVSFVNPSKEYYNDKIKPFGFDINKAKEILRSDGWKDRNGNGIVDKVIDGKLTDFKVDYYASGKLGSDIGLLLKEDAAKAGMDIDVIKQDFSITKKEHIATGDYGMMASAITQGLEMDDPYLRFHSDNATLGGANFTMYKNPRVDELCMIIKETADQKELDKAFAEIQEIIYEDQPVIFLYVPKGRFMSNKKWNLKVSSKRPGFFPNAFELAPSMATK